MTLLTDNLTAIDRELSNRQIDLDPNGYFIIYIDREHGAICAKHYTNVIDDRGLAVDPETGKVIPAKGSTTRTSTTLFTGRTAKELCVKILGANATLSRGNVKSCSLFRTRICPSRSCTNLWYRIYSGLNSLRVVALLTRDLQL